MKNIFFLLFIFSISTYTSAQINIGQRIKEKVKQRADQKVDKAIDQGLDSVEASGKKSKKEKTKIEKEEDTEPKIKTKSESEMQQVSAVTDVSLISYSKFDFVPGEKTIFFDDFAQDNIGDFPVKWNTNGKGEVVTNNRYPGKWLKMRNSTTYLPEISSTKFPDNYTIEYDMVVTGEDRHGTFNLELTSLPNKQQVPGAGDNPGAGLYLTTQMNPSGQIRYLIQTTLTDGSNAGGNTDLDDETLTGKPNEKFHVSIAVNKQRFRYYVNEVKVLDLPRVLPAVNYNAFVFRMWGWGDDHPFDALFSNFRYAEGITDVRSKLITEGKLVTRGILFDVNSDKIKPESYGTLKEIAQVLKDNATVNVKIIGHTDSDGSAAANLDLSKKRSASVKNALSKDFGIDATRMQTDGKGASEPASPNTTAEGKANNRRVEFIKL
jgi:outer membrane protein OmpA-like peptidoglycan-associated protein